MNRIDFSNIGGFPLEQDTLGFLQDSYKDMFSGLAALIGDKVILSGVQVIGGIVSGGWITYGGEILRFVGGGAGDGVVIVESLQAALFEDGSSKDVYKTRYATIGSPGTFPFSDLKPVSSVVVINDTLAVLDAAFVNHNHNYDTLDNRPAGKIVYMGTLNIGDISTDITRTIQHNLNINPANYQVMATMWGNDASGNAWDFSNDISWIFYDKQPNYFKIGIREYNPVVQNIRLEYMIVKPL